MAILVYLGLHGAKTPQESRGADCAGNRALDNLGWRLGCPVYDWPAATQPDPYHRARRAGKPTPKDPQYVPTRVIKYLAEQISRSEGTVCVRLFGWSTGAVMLCRIARDLAHCPLIPKAGRVVDLCFAMDPLWSLAVFGQYPKIPNNVRRWVCVRQNRHGDRPPTHSPLDKRFWQGVRLQTASDETQYDELNLATGNVIGQPGFRLSADSQVTHGQIPILTKDIAHQVLTA